MAGSALIWGALVVVIIVIVAVMWLGSRNRQAAFRGPAPPSGRAVQLFEGRPAQGGPANAAPARADGQARRSPASDHQGSEKEGGPGRAAEIGRGGAAPSSRTHWARFGGSLSDGRGVGGEEAGAPAARGGRSGSAGSVVDGMRDEFSGMETIRSGFAPTRSA